MSYKTLCQWNQHRTHCCIFYVTGLSIAAVTRILFLRWEFEGVLCFLLNSGGFLKFAAISAASFLRDWLDSCASLRPHVCCVQFLPLIDLGPRLPRGVRGSGFFVLPGFAPHPPCAMLFFVDGFLLVLSSCCIERL